MSKDFLLALGIHRIPIALPFAGAGGPVNVYVFEREEGGLALFDAGFGTRSAEESFRVSLQARGLEVCRIQDIYVSHGHVDHFGLAQTLAEESGATVHVHARDFRKVVGPSPLAEVTPGFEARFRRLGVPEGDLRLSLSLLRQQEKFARRVDPERARVLAPGTRLQFRRSSVEVLEMPGHTPGLVCLWDAEHRLFFADDHVLARVSPSPLLESGFRALEAYLASAQRVYDLDIEWVLPGHGAAFQGHREVLGRFFDACARQQDLLLGLLAEGPCTAHGLAQKLLGPHPPTRLFLTLSAVVGDLEVLEAAGRVERVEEPGVDRYRLPCGETRSRSWQESQIG